jgi:hypothetical protein
MNNDKNKVSIQEKTYRIDTSEYEPALIKGQIYTETQMTDKMFDILDIQELLQNDNIICLK